MTGNTFFLEEIEAVINQYQGVKESRVWLDDYELLGEVVVSHGDVDEKDILEFCNERLDAAIHVEQIRIVESLPRTMTGKVSRKLRIKN